MKKSEEKREDKDDYARRGSGRWNEEYCGI